MKYWSSKIIHNSPRYSRSKYGRRNLPEWYDFCILKFVMSLFLFTSIFFTKIQHLRLTTVLPVLVLHLRDIQFSAKKPLICSSSHLTSSIFPGGPPAQWPHMDGKTSNLPIPGDIFATSFSESSGLYCHQQQSRGKVKWTSLREIQISLWRQHQGFGFYGAHGFFEVSIIRWLSRAISTLPRLQHDEQILGV